MIVLLLPALTLATAQAAPHAGPPSAVSMDMHWDAGAEDCTRHPAPPIEVHACNADTFVLRESPCCSWEAPFMYLLLGSEKALLIDTGDERDPPAPLLDTVLGLLPEVSGSKLPLVVVHSHTHLDHRGGDRQFQGQPGVELVPADLDHVRAFFGLQDWPDGVGSLDLGGRPIDVLPAPGHQAAHVVYYDHNTEILFTGDFLLPGRILVDDREAYRESARRIAAFVADRPVTCVLGGHIEKDRGGRLFEWKSTHHPDEAPLPLSKADVLALPEALEAFNGFYSRTGNFVIMNPIHVLVAIGAAALVALATLGYGVWALARRSFGRHGRKSPPPLHAGSPS
jgi:hydroxyacylglutathione hydrolase